MTGWFRKLFSPPAAASKRRPTRLRLEPLEDRLVLASWIVNATTDTGAGAAGKGDLRYCTTNAVSGDTIYMDPSMAGKTIDLTKQIKLTNSVSILGQTSGGDPVNVTVSGQNKTRIFEIASASETINNLTFTAGNGTDGAGTAGNGGAILEDAGSILTLNTDNFTTNKTTGEGTNGGAIENDSALDVYGCNFTSNTSNGAGGAIENTSNLVVAASQGGTASVFTSNTVMGIANGGAIDCRNPQSLGSLTVSNTNFYSNSTLSGTGGAISTNMSATLTNDIFGAKGQSNNAGSGGGAIIAEATPPNYLNVQLNVTSCTFAYNQAVINGGGAIWTNAPTDVEESTFTGNTVSGNGYGGAIYSSVVSNASSYNSTLKINLDTFGGPNLGEGNSAQTGGAVYSSADINGGGYLDTVVTNSTFVGNSAVNGGKGLGGALRIYEEIGANGSNADATLTNDTFFKNTSDNHGGAIALALVSNLGGTPTAKLTSLTITQNTAMSDSGGLYVDTNLLNTVLVDNSILSGNTVTAPGYRGPVDATQTGAGAIDDLGFNLVGTSDTMFTNGTDVDRTDTPGLATSLAQNGAPAGYPQTLALQTTSPGYEHGDQTLATDTDGRQLDERGKTRPSGEVSIGAEDPDAS